VTDSDTAAPAAGARFAADATGARWTFAGDLTFATAGAVFEASQALALPGSGTVDCAGIGAVDSSAIAVLLELQRRAAAEGRSLAFANVPASLRALAELYGVAEFLVPR
jgi:phospholipid transport system transporter-binding protein